MITQEENNRILIIDDNPAIHDDFRKILRDGRRENSSETDDLLSAVLGTVPGRNVHVDFEMDSAHQGQEGLALVEAALKERRPYALAFVDIRMPPGWDGVETITHLWSRDPALQVVICTAYSDYSWRDIVEKLGNSDRLVILKKPFDNIEVLQLAHAMTRKWMATCQAAAKFEDLDQLVRSRTRELEGLNRALSSEIAEREQAQAALRLSEERLARAFEACPLPTAILQVYDQHVIQANAAMLSATGRGLEEMVGRSFWETDAVSSNEFRRTAVSRLLRGEALRRQEYIFLAKDGERRRGLLWLEPFALASGPHVLAILQDTTEQDLMESQLRQSQKMEAVGHLAAGIAHDFNNLLTVIHGHTSISLLTADLDHRVADSLAAVQQAAGRAADLTRQLLAFSSQQVLEKNNISLSGTVTNVSAMLRRLIPENIQLHFTHTGESTVIKADRCNIEQALLNLVVNARDALPKGGEIFVSTAVVDVPLSHTHQVPQAREGRFVRLEVRDNGEGMDEKVRRQIFTPFFTTKPMGRGTGMGLATVHGIVNQHGGWIEVFSEPGEGTHFHLFFPVSEREPVPEPPPVRRPAPTVVGAGWTVLLVEDDDEVRALAKRVLEKFKLRVIEATDGPSALALWEEHGKIIDILLTDMVMPGGLSGAEVADSILAARPNLPVIYSSGYSVNLFEETRQVRKDGNYLPKPYLAGELIDIVSRAIVERAEPSVKS